MATILIVEDDRKTNEAICEYLKPTGHTVIPAYDGGEALQLFAQNPIDLVVLDIMLPHVSGLSVLHEIRRTSTTPVLMLTAIGDEYTQAMSFDEQADDYIYNAEDGGYTGQEIRVQIIGLFTPNVLEQFGETVTTYDMIQNRVFVDLQTSKELDGGTINYGFHVLHVAIDDPQDMARVVDDVKALPGIDWTAFTIEADNETYENAAAPLAALNELIVTLLVVIIVVSAIILALILTLWTKTRIHEIGVFLSVGIKKSAIVGQYLVEVLLIAVLAFGLSYFTSNAIAGQIGNHLLEQSTQTEPGEDDVVSAAASVEIGADNLIQNPLPTESGIQVSVGLDNLAQLYLIGLAIIIVAVSASSITVMRLKPREILSKMS